MPTGRRFASSQTGEMYGTDLPDGRGDGELLTLVCRCCERGAAGTRSKASSTTAGGRSRATMAASFGSAKTMRVAGKLMLRWSAVHPHRAQSDWKCSPRHTSGHCEGKGVATSVERTLPLRWSAVPSAGLRLARGWLLLCLLAGSCKSATARPQHMPRCAAGYVESKNTGEPWRNEDSPKCIPTESESD